MTRKAGESSQRRRTQSGKWDHLSLVCRSSVRQAPPPSPSPHLPFPTAYSNSEDNRVGLLPLGDRRLGLACWQAWGQADKTACFESTSFCIALHLLLLYLRPRRGQKYFALRTRWHLLYDYSLFFFFFFANHSFNHHGDLSLWARVGRISYLHSHSFDCDRGPPVTEALLKKT